MKVTKIVAAVLAGLTFSACGKDATAPDPAIDAAGTYQMVTFNGTTPPVTIYSDAVGTIEVLGGNEVLRADHTYSENWDIRTTYNPGYGCECTSTSTQVVESGNFDISGTTITFHPDDGSASYTGNVSNGVVSYDADALSVTYQK